jgi:hypothetical protein
MDHVVDVVKHGNRPAEVFHIDKLRDSIYAACLSERSPEGQASTTARQVCDAVIRWCANKHEVTSDDIRRQAALALAIHYPEAAYLYKHYRKII